MGESVIKKRTSAAVHPLLLGLLCGLLIFPARNVYFILLDRWYLPAERVLVYLTEAFGMTVQLAISLLFTAVCLQCSRIQRTARIVIGTAIVLSSSFFLICFSMGAGCTIIHPQIVYDGTSLIRSLYLDFTDTVKDPVTFILWLCIAAMWNIGSKRRMNDTLLFGAGCSAAVILVFAATVAVSLGTIWYVHGDIREIIEPAMSAIVYAGCFACGVWMLVSRRWKSE